MAGWDYGKAECGIYDSQGVSKSIDIDVEGGTGFGGDGKDYYRVVVHFDDEYTDKPIFLTVGQVHALKEVLDIAYYGASEQEIDELDEEDEGDLSEPEAAEVKRDDRDQAMYYKGAISTKIITACALLKDASKYCASYSSTDLKTEKDLLDRVCSHIAAIGQRVTSKLDDVVDANE